MKDITGTLKIVEPHYSNVKTGAKKAELRRLDRDFAVGQKWILAHFDPGTNCFVDSEPILIRITHILWNVEGLKPGYGIISFEKLN